MRRHEDEDVDEYGLSYLGCWQRGRRMIGLLSLPGCEAVAVLSRYRRGDPDRTEWKFRLGADFP